MISNFIKGIVEGKGSMERLTMEYCGEYMPKELCSIDRLGGADDCDLCCEYCKATEEGNEDCRECAISKCFNKLGEYEDLEEQGKLLKLPAAIGDEIFFIFLDCPKDYKEEYCRDHEGSCENCHHRVPGIVSRDFRMSDIPNMDKIFATKEAAEAALKEMSE